jgi:hypothetical protein
MFVQTGWQDALEQRSLTSRPIQCCEKPTRNAASYPFSASQAGGPPELFLESREFIAFHLAT